jgi:hypothetical protein
MNQKRGTIFVLVMLVLAVSVSAETEGCYLNPSADDFLYCNKILLTQAQEHCEIDTSCNQAEDFFIPLSDCISDDPTQPEYQCQQVQCDLDCQFQTKGKCEADGGTEVTPELQNVMCTPGCCIFKKSTTETSCQANYVAKECQIAGEEQGFPTDFIPGSDLAACNALCEVGVTKSSITGTIIDAGGAVILGAKVLITGLPEKITATDGVYFADEMIPGIYVVKVSADGFLPQSAEVTVSADTPATKDFQLAELVGGFTLIGTVSSVDGQALANVKLTYVTSSTSGETVTDSNGEYLIEQLPEGPYEITASSIGFSPSVEQLTLNIDLTLDFTLNKPISAGVEGVTLVDFTGDLIGEPFATDIYIDDVFRGKSKFPDGLFSIPLELFEAGSEHKIQSFYQDYQSEAQNFLISEGELTQVPAMVLFTYIGECSKDQENERKNVASFSLSPVKGEERVQLQWTKPCAEVSGYVVSKTNLLTGEEKLQWQAFPPSINTYSDSDVDWDTAYEYGIRAVYTDDEIRESEESNVQQISIGNEVCEGRFHDATLWETFCQIEQRQQVFTCDDDNNVFIGSDCAQLAEPGKQYYCAQVSATKSLCKDAAICSISATPFGLYSTANSCYGNSAEDLADTNYCVYDYSLTPVNQCMSCTIVESCFDYQSKGACQINNCVSEQCKWVDALSSDKVLNYEILSPLASQSAFFVTPETGAGYCVSEDYKQDDKCNLCGPYASLFENNYCTPDVCSDLGRCFSGDQLEFCEECGPVPTSDATCYQYESVEECEGDSGVSIDSFGGLTPSKDSCSWGTCKWNNGACIKDSDGDEQDDCASVQGTSNCQIDNKAPQTIIFPQGLPVISLTKPEITFEGDDSFHVHTSQKNPMGEIWYCITSSTETDTCTIDRFVSKKYPGGSPKETVIVNLLEFPGLGLTANQGSAYKLKFFSKDSYNNQEDVQQTFVYIDNVPPKFTITMDPQTAGDTSSLEVTLNNMVEPMGCTFALESKLPKGDKQSQSVSRDDEFKQVIFENLKSIHYQINVTCTDDRSNTNSEAKDVVFDLQQGIDVVYPPPNGFVGKNKIAFEINTLVGSSCELFETTTNTKVATFNTDSDGKLHMTDTITVSKAGGNAGSYAGLYKVICTGFLDNNIFDELLNFEVDLSAPDTEITLVEGSHSAFPTVDNWEEFFIKSVDVSLSCDVSGFSGVACSQIFYCLGDGCDAFDNPSYVEFIEPFTMEESSRICYFSNDLDNHKPKVICGDIKVEGYGITLLKPNPYTFDGEIYGVSGTPIFDWEFATAIPSDECRFDFNPDFDYDNVESFKVLTSEDGVYKYPDFPGEFIFEYAQDGAVKTVYIKCKNAEGEISPEQMMNLEYDPFNAEIIDSFAEPELVVEGLSTILHVETENKATCRYIDNTNGVGAEFATMPYSFSEDEGELFVQHLSEFKININKAQQDFIISVQCMSGAGNFSEVKNISFSVDYLSKGVISSVYPDGEFFNTDVITLQAQTSRVGQCSFEHNNLTQLMIADGNTHTAEISGFSEKKYVVPVSCIMGDHPAEASISFTIDKTGPVLKNITDGDYTCGQDTISINLGTAEIIQSASYQIFEKGLFYGSSSVGSGGTSSANPLLISVANLTKDKKYFVKVTAVDSAGNVGTEASSDGFTVTDANFSVCKQDKSAPDVSVKLDKSQCSAIYASFECTDETGCKDIKYGVSSSAITCTPDLAALGGIEFTQKGYLCYAATDNTGKSKTSSYLVNYPDDDGDGILDSCDYCSGTTAGAVVDENGCASDELTPFEAAADTDQDGLPDTWELQHNSVECPFDHLAEDSDNDGLSDASNDYDKDGRSNFVEYSQSSDPCAADAEIEDDEPTKPVDKTPITPKKDSNLFAWILFMLGLLMFVGGAGYLVYYYKSKGGKPLYKPVTQAGAKPVSKLAEQTWKPDRSEHIEKAKQRERRGIFGAFGLPHIGKMVHKSEPTPKNLHAISKKYVEHKTAIGSKPGEKSVFAKLESLATKKKPDVNKKEAKDIFAKLKKISDKRKGD